MIVDDLIATGGTVEAICHIVEKNAGGSVAGIFNVIGLPFLKYEEKLRDYRVDTLINYDGE